MCMATLTLLLAVQVRHPADYGAIVLLDERHSHAEAQQHLPTWLRAQGLRTQVATRPPAPYRRMMPRCR